MALDKQDFSIFAGETKTLSVTSTTESTGALIDFTGATITWILKNGSTTVLTKTVGSGITVTGTGTFTIALTAVNTTGLSGFYQHECRTTLADGTVSTLFTGTMTAKPTLTA